MESLTTTFNGDLANEGAMFDVRAFPNKSVIIKSLSFRSTEAKPCDVQVFTKSGSHKYFEDNRHAWTEIVNESTQCMGPKAETVIDENAFINIEELGVERGDERAFYIRVDGTELVYSPTVDNDQVYSEDSNIQILQGVGLSNYFRDYVEARMWNGAIYYEVISFDDASDTCTNELIVDSDMSGNNSNYGIMFNIRNNVDEHIEILGFSFHTDTTHKVHYNIYSIPGGFEYGKQSLNPWTNVAIGSHHGDMSPIVVSDGDFDTVNIAPSQTQGFFITLDTQALIYRTSPLAMGSTYVQNEMIALTIGTGVGDSSPPLGSTFYDSRGFYGRIFYRTKDACKVQTSVTYNFVVIYPIDWDIDRLFGNMSVSMKEIVTEILQSHGDFKTITQDVLFIKDPVDTSPCSASSASKACIRVAAIMTLVHEWDMDEGAIIYSLLASADKATAELNTDSLQVYYAGDEPLDTTMIITLAGVPKRRMGVKQIEFFSKQTKLFLERANADSDVVEILSVDIETQTLQFEPNEIDSGEKEIPRSRLLEEDTTSIDLTTVVTGKHRPPSPGLDFDTLIEDSINADTSSFKEELIKDATNEEGGSYFQYVEGVRASQTGTLAPTPTTGPTSQLLVYEGVDPYDIQGTGLGLVAIVLIVIVASIFAFACVFGTFIWKRRQLEQKRFKMEEESLEGDEEDPLFYDIFRGKNNPAKKHPPPSNPSFPIKVSTCDDQSRRSDRTPDTGFLSDQSTDNNVCRSSYAQEVMVYDNDDDNDVDSFVVASRPSLERRISSSRRRSSQSSAISSGIVSSIMSSESDDEYGEGVDNSASYHSGSNLENTHHTSNQHDHHEPLSSRVPHDHNGGYSGSPEMRGRYNSHYEREESIASISTSSTLSTQGPIPGQSLSRQGLR